MKSFLLYIFTLKDVGCERIFYRIYYFLREKFDKLFFSLITFKKDDSFIWNKDVFINLKKIKLKEAKFSNKNINLFFLNQINNISIPFNWFDKENTRLWNFNLHYFDWGIFWMEDLFYKNNENSNFFKMGFLIDDWIDFNLKNYTDGWHSYTLSLRIRNWIWFFRYSPELITNYRLKILWFQILWLYNHQERYLEGNHYLENLMTLVFASLQFNNFKAKRIFNESFNLLKVNLNKQILKDGGHEERSSSYHLYLLKRLIETALMIETVMKIRPQWIMNKITLMINWSKKIELRNNRYPRFNDSFFAKDINLKEIIEFGESYLRKANLISNKKSLYFQLISTLYPDSNKKLSIFKKERSMIYPKIIDLPSTGWTILRPGKLWEIVFKSGVSCPPHLPAHAHSDILSFDILNNGKGVIEETGTSTYQYSKIRKFERSGIAHNLFILSEEKFEKLTDFNVIEPLEVWSSFRAARKSKIIKRKNGSKDNTIWCSCEFCPFSNFLISQKRSIFATTLEDSTLNLKIIDEVISSKELFWNLFLHLSPKQEDDYLKSIFENRKLQAKDYIWIDNWTSYKYGEKIPSRTLLIFGNINFGLNVNEFELNLKK